MFQSLAGMLNFVPFPYEPEMCVLRTVFNFLLVYHKRTLSPSKDSGKADANRLMEMLQEEKIGSAPNFEAGPSCTC